MTKCSCCGTVTETDTASDKVVPIKLLDRAARYWRKSGNPLPPTMVEILKIVKGNDDELA